MSEENSRKAPLSRNFMDISMAEASAMFPGFRFSPTDDELIQYYLKKKLQGFEDGLEVIPELDICRHEPWDLPAQSMIQSDNEWFFFSPRGKKYPSGSQSKRATASGYWKATGKERIVKSGSNLIGTKRTLVFHMGRAPRGQRTEWIMHEYCAAEKSQDDMVVCRLRKNSEFHVGDSLMRNFNNQSDLPSANDCGVEMLDKEQSPILEGADVAESCSKECSNSYNSNSVEQVDTGHESDEKISNEFDSSSLKQGCAAEEDCYADIMKDDIIKLDYSSLKEIRGSGKCEPDMASKQPGQDTNLQGTGSQQLRQGKQTPKTYQREPSDTDHKSDKENLSIDSVPNLGSLQAAENSIAHFAASNYKVSSMIIFLGILILLVTFFLKADPWETQKLIGVFKFRKWKDINWNRYLPSVMCR
ncbi:NAC domain-containing protein 40-like [Primulina eburnea]|uniref:NAC domain-containing protein 40-like n=1 Tax=Primulina eburnea TaxID=1245227 RepID=UPI003C6BFA03